jgi:hypothetical protein
MKNLTLAVLLLAAGCTTTSHQVTGTLHPEVPADAVKIYYRMPDNATVVGVVSADSFAGVDVQQATDDAVIKLKAQAGRLGANGVFINGLQNSQPLSGAKITGEAILVSP